MQRYQFLNYLVPSLLIPAPSYAQSPVSNLQLNSIYSRFSNCIVNEYRVNSKSVDSQAKCLGLIMEASDKFLSFIDIKNGFSYGFHTSYQGEEFLINFYTDKQNQVKYFVMGNKNFTFGGPAHGLCEEYLKDKNNHIITCAAQILDDQLGNGVKNQYTYAAAINLHEIQERSDNPSLSTNQAVCIASMVGAMISGNSQAALALCQNQSTQQPNRANNRPAQTPYNPNREWLNNSMEDTDRFIGGNGWRDIERNPSGF